MIRTSKHTIKFSNTNKINNLHIFIKEYRKVASVFLDYIWTNGYIWEYKNNIKEFNINKNLLEFPTMLCSDLIEKTQLNTFLTGRAIKCCLTQIAGMIKASTEKQRKRLYILNKLKEENKPRKYRKQLIVKIKQNIPVKPNHNNINPELNSICCKFRELKSNDFNGFLRLTSITKDKIDIKIPIKYNRHSNKLMNKGKLKNSFSIKEDSVDFRWEIPNIEKKEKGIIVGADQGFKDVLTLSDKQTTPKEDNHGHTLGNILFKLSRKKKGSKSFRRATEHRKNFINWSINKLDLSNIKQIKLEKIWNIGYKKSKSRILSHWTNTLIRDKVERRCEELGVQVLHQDSTYRSQRCSECGMVRKSNRKGKIYECKNCGLIIDSDYNASLNHEIDLFEIPYGFRNLRLNRHGFFWKDTGLYNIEGGNLQFPLPENRLS